MIKTGNSRGLRIAGGVLFFYLLIVLCPIVGQVSSIYIGYSLPTFGLLYAQDGKKKPRQMTDFTAKVAPAKAEPDVPRKADAELATDVQAADSEKKDSDIYTYEKPKEEESSYGWLIFKTIIVLILFGVAFYFFFKFISQKAGLPNVGRGVVQVLAVSPVGQGKFLQIVDIAGRVMILGVTDASVTLISEVTDRDEIDRIRLLSSKSTPLQTHGFQDFVSEQMGSLIELVGKAKSSLEKKKNVRQEEPEEYLDDRKVDYMREQRERLKKLNGYKDDNEK